MYSHWATLIDDTCICTAGAFTTVTAVKRTPTCLTSINGTYINTNRQLSIDY